VNVDEFEAYVIQNAAEWAYIRLIETIDKTDHAVKIRLFVDPECFVQVYHNVQKGVLSFALVLNRSRIFGHDNQGGNWHRHPYGDPESHDQSPQGQTKINLSQFLEEVQNIIKIEGIL
jgi:hypothetical protein